MQLPRILEWPLADKTWSLVRQDMQLSRILKCPEIASKRSGRVSLVSYHRCCVRSSAVSGICLYRQLISSSPRPIMMHLSIIWSETVVLSNCVSAFGSLLKVMQLSIIYSVIVHNLVYFPIVSQDMAAS